MAWRAAVFALLTWCVAALVIACGHQGDPEGEADFGSVSLPLVTTSGSVQYRLSDAVISLDGPTSTQMASSGDPAEGVLTATLVAGDYSATLEPGWVLERDAGSGFRAVQAELLSPNPHPVTIRSGVTTALTYRFETDGTIIAVGDGELQIDLQVVETGGGAACEDEALASVGIGLHNGGFEEPAIPPASVLTISPGLEPTGFGWTPALSVEVVRVGWTSRDGVVTGPAHSGSQYLDIVALGSEGSMRQTLEVSPGTTYRLSLAYANNPVTPALPSASATVSIDDCDSALFSETLTHSTSTISNFDWSTFSRTFVATDRFVTLELVSTVGGGNGGLFFDSVALESLP
jgi:hypothetical protein